MMTVTIIFCKDVLIKIIIKKVFRSIKGGSLVPHKILTKTLSFLNGALGYPQYHPG